MSFFKRFNRVLYDANEDGIRREAVNILNSIIVKFRQVENVTLYFYHMIEDGEKPEDVADRYYNDSELNWVVLLVNSVVNPFYDWPLTQQELSALAADRYDNPNGIHHFIDLDTGKREDEVAHSIYQGLLDNDEAIPANIGLITNLEYEFERNNERREIKILNRIHLNDFILQFERLMERKLLNAEDV